jgi:hypothetical protein
MSSTIADFRKFLARIIISRSGRHTMFDRAAIVRAAKSYLGVRFRHQGRDRTGLDCVGLVVRVCNDLGMAVTDTLDYKRAPDAAVFRRILLGIVTADLFSVSLRVHFDQRRIHGATHSCRPLAKISRVTTDDRFLERRDLCS